MPFLDYYALLIEGLIFTLLLFFLSEILALVVACIVGLGLHITNSFVRGLLTTYVEIFRGTSLFVQIFWFYFVLPYFGISLSPLVCGVLALGLHGGAYCAEIVRGALRAVNRGQNDAAVALNMTQSQFIRYVLVPQAFLYCIRPLGVNAIEALKATSIVSVVAFPELLFQAQVVRSQVGNTAALYGLVFGLYYLVTLLISHIFGKLELFARRTTTGVDIR